MDDYGNEINRARRKRSLAERVRDKNLHEIIQLIEKGEQGIKALLLENSNQAPPNSC